MVEVIQTIAILVAILAGLVLLLAVLSGINDPEQEVHPQQEPRTWTERKDNWTSMLVTIALQMEPEKARLYLSTQGVPIEIAHRVLLNPDKRRAA